jgi:hypothetical protein
VLKGGSGGSIGGEGTKIVEREKRLEDGRQGARVVTSEGVEVEIGGDDRGLWSREGGVEQSESML